MFEALYMKISPIGRTNPETIYKPKYSTHRYRVTSAVERVDFWQSSALSFNKYYMIPKQIKSKTSKEAYVTVHGKTYFSAYPLSPVQTVMIVDDS